MLVVRYIHWLKVPVLSSSGNIACLPTIPQQVHFELLGVFQLTPDLIKNQQPTAAFCNFYKGVVVLELDRKKQQNDLD